MSSIEVTTQFGSLAGEIQKPELPSIAFEYFTSKKWLHSTHYEPSIRCLFLNQEGKTCPQKIAYFPSMQSETDQDLVIRQYKLFSETVLQTVTAPCTDHLYCSSSNGLVYKVGKKDIARLLHRQKEKLKGNICKKVLKIQREGSKFLIEVPSSNGFKFREDESESYLKSANTVAISTMALSNDYPDVNARYNEATKTFVGSQQFLALAVRS